MCRQSSARTCSFGRWSELKSTHMMFNASDHIMNSLMCMERIRFRFTALCSILNESDVCTRIHSAFHSEVPFLVRWRWSSVQRCLSAVRKAHRCLIARLSLQKYAGWLVGGRRHWKRGCARRGRGRVDMLVEVSRADEAIRDAKFGHLLLHAWPSVWQASRRSRVSVYQRLSGAFNPIAFCSVSVPRSRQWPLGDGKCLGDRHAAVGGFRACAG